MVVVAGQSSDPESTGAAEGSTSAEPRILMGTPVLKEMPVPVPVGP